ncbi:hypothetical protein KJ359_011466 [Pestalotiopsis sp. 9143b]|nr:hypothetical protein KJ359_011466 [Pestalotiopsis sp. 9143b]
MCQKKILGPYPCGHFICQWINCGLVNVKGVLVSTARATPCRTFKNVTEEADLSLPCHSTCLTKPFVCTECPDEHNQVTWKCNSCGHLRCSNCKYWDECLNKCGRLTLEKGGAGICGECKKFPPKKV